MPKLNILKNKKIVEERIGAFTKKGTHFSVSEVLRNSLLLDGDWNQLGAIKEYDAYSMEWKKVTIDDYLIHSHLLDADSYIRPRKEWLSSHHEQLVEAVDMERRKFLKEEIKKISDELKEWESVKEYYSTIKHELYNEEYETWYSEWDLLNNPYKYNALGGKYKINFSKGEDELSVNIEGVYLDIKGPKYIVEKIINNIKNSKDGFVSQEEFWSEYNYYVIGNDFKFGRNNLSDWDEDGVDIAKILIDKSLIFKKITEKESSIESENAVKEMIVHMLRRGEVSHKFSLDGFLNFLKILPTDIYFPESFEFNSPDWYEDTIQDGWNLPVDANIDKILSDIQEEFLYSLLLTRNTKISVINFSRNTWGDVWFAWKHDDQSDFYSYIEVCSVGFDRIYWKLRSRGFDIHGNYYSLGSKQRKEKERELLHTKTYNSGDTEEFIPSRVSLYSSWTLPDAFRNFMISHIVQSYNKIISPEVEPRGSVLIKPKRNYDEDEEE